MSTKSDEAEVEELVEAFAHEWVGTEQWASMSDDGRALWRKQVQPAFCVVLGRAVPAIEARAREAALREVAHLLPPNLAHAGNGWAVKDLHIGATPPQPAPAVPDCATCGAPPLFPGATGCEKHATVDEAIAHQPTMERYVDETNVLIARLDHERNERLAHPAPARPTFEQLVARVGELPQTGLASAELRQAIIDNYPGVADGRVQVVLTASAEPDPIPSSATHSYIDDDAPAGAIPAHAAADPILAALPIDEQDERTVRALTNAAQGGARRPELDEAVLTEAELAALDEAAARSGYALPRHVSSTVERIIAQRLAARRGT